MTRAVSRARTIASERERIWELIADPYHLPRWWPSVTRVEDVGTRSWTSVLRTPRGRTVRADYKRTSAERPRRIVWRQLLEGSPFERVFASVEIVIELDAVEGGQTRVELSTVEALNGRFKFGGLMVRRAARRRLGEALEGLEHAVEGSP
ncbi:MAG: hypothetical protein NVSMB25_07040 [Thermoleophilaceae bacterium]